MKKKIDPKYLRLAHRVLKAEIALAKIAAEKAQTFEEAIKDQKFKHPDTGNDVVFNSLPAEEQKKIRAEFDKENPSEKELSKEDKKVLDELSDLDLDSDDLMALFDKVVAEMDLSDPPDLSELEGMDKDELEDQAESLLMNFDEGAEALMKSLDELGLGEEKEEKKEEDDDKPKVDPKKKENLEKIKDDFDQIAKWSDKADALDEEWIQAAIESALKNPQIKDKSDEDLDTSGMSKEELMETLRDLASNDPSWASELFTDAENYVQDVAKEAGQDHYDRLEDEGFKSAKSIDKILSEATSSADIDSAIKEYNKVKGQHATKYRDAYKEMVEKYGEDVAYEAWPLESTPSEMTSEEWDALLKSDLDYDLPTLQKIKTKKQNAEKAKEEKDRKEKELKEKKEKHKKREVSTEERAERKKKLDSAISKIDDISFSEEDLEHDDSFYHNYNAAVLEVTEELTTSIEEAYGLEREDSKNRSSKILGLDNLDDDELDTIISSITSSREKLNKKFKEQITELKKLSETELEPDLDKTSKALQKSLRESNEIEKKLEKLTNGWHDELPEDHPLMVRSAELDTAIEELSTKQEDLDHRISEIKEMRSNKSFEGDEYEDMNSMLSHVLAEKSGRDLKKKEEAEVKAMQEAEEAAKAQAEKEEQERQEKIKAHTKKLSEIQSSASSAKDSKEVTDLLSEFGRIKGQLSGSNMMDDLKGDIDKTQKALDDAKEKNSLSGRIKNFFGLGKKASQAQRDKVAKLALELLQEEIALYKEEGARRNRKR